MAALVARGAAGRSAGAVRADTWMYRFGWRSPHSAGALGAWHALDVPFALGTYADSPELGDPCRSLLAPNEAKRRRRAEALYTETPR